MLTMQSTDAPAAASLAAAGADLRYWVAFSHVPGIGPARLGALIERLGSVEAAWHAPASALDGLLDQRSRTAFLSARTESDPDELLARVAAAGARAVTWDDPAYPARLRRVPLPPYLLYVRGNPALLDTRAVAVVGTRRASAYGRRAAAEIAGQLAAAGVTIVSGLALGVDAVAHQAALDAGGATVAVLGCGVDIVYPERNRTLTGRIATEGALISEYPPSRPPDAGNFPARNRIVSGLSLATLVVEAGVKSGALITAGFALEQGGDVFAVPGSIFSPLSEGTNLLIANGAGVARSADDILAALDLTRAAEQNAARRSLPTDPTEAALLLHLAAEPMHIDDLARAAGLGSADVARALTMMELKGLVQHTGGMRWVAA
jgi:DNA processing protein